MVTEGNCSWWLMASGARAALDARHRAQRHLRAAGGRDVDPRQRGRVALVLRHRLQHHAVLVGLGVDGGDLALAEGVVERIVDGLHGDAEPPGRLAVDLHHGAQAAVLGLRHHLAQHGRGAQLLGEAAGPQRHLLLVAADQRVLELRPADARADLHVLHRLEVDGDAGDGADLLLQPVDDGGDVGLALVARLEGDLQVAGVGRGVERADADDRDDARHVGVGADGVGDLVLQLHHLGEGDLRAGLHHRLDEPRVLQRQEALGHDHVEADGDDQRADRRQQRRPLVAQHPQQGAVVARQRPGRRGR